MLECFFSFLAPVVHLLKVFVRQLKELAISAIIPHHSCNTDLSKRDTSRSGSLAAVIRCSVIFCLLWFCCFSGTFMKHAADPLPPPVRSPGQKHGRENSDRAKNKLETQNNLVSLITQKLT